MILKNMTLAILLSFVFSKSVHAQSKSESLLCQAAKSSRSIELIYDRDVSKGCLPRLVDVHQLALGNNGKLYLHGWQNRGCTKGRDYASERIFRLDKIKSVKLIEGEFNEKSQSIKSQGWDGCIGSNCFIREIICQ